MDRKYVDIQWLVKIKTDSKGDVHYEKWSQPLDEGTELVHEDEDEDEDETRHVLTKPKILTVEITLREIEQRNANTRYVLSAADYQRLVDAVK